MNVSQKYVLANRIAVLATEVERRAKYKINQYFPDEGDFRRELYGKALAFFKGGAQYPERLLLGGNRTGKTEAASYEVSCHLTGVYPEWWEGRRFDHPVDIWAAGDTATTTRDICQLSLYGPVPAAPRSGMIPAHLIKHATPKNSIPGAVETIYVNHSSGGLSSIQFKSYDQRREAFQGTARHIIWLDEECPEDVYTECLMRTLTCQGIVIVTFTPVEGLTPFVQNWLEQSVMIVGDEGGNPVVEAAEAQVFRGDQDDDLSGVDPDPVTAFPEMRDPNNVVAEDTSSVKVALSERQKLITMISWDEVPHLSKAAQIQMLSSIPPYQRAARTRGIPNLGSGVVYPVPEDDIKVKPFPIPDHFVRGYGMDVGWNWTVALHGAYDRESGIMYLYREHYRQHAEPPVHVAGIQAAGDWIPGRIDPAANGRNQLDGKQLLQAYLDLGLRIDMAPNGVESGIEIVWTMLTAGRIKVFSHLKHFFTEYRMYRRDAKGMGKIVKKHDHLMDAMRYLIASGTDWMAYPPTKVVAENWSQERGRGSWMG